MAKIAHLLDSCDYSGAEKIALELIENDKYNDSWYVSRNGSIREVLVKRKVKFFLYNNFQELRSFFKQQSFDIVHCHDYKASIRSVMLKVNHRVSHIHNNSITSTKVNIKTLLYLACSVKFDRIIYVSNVTKEEFVFRKYIKCKSVVIPNWINKKERLCNDNLKKDIDILYVGRLKREKNPIEVIKLAQRLLDFKKNINICMFGNGEQEKELRSMIIDMNLNNNISLNSFVDNPHYYMKRAKILFVPSKWEGFGLVVLEAMLNDAIVFANAVGGIKDIIHNGENGFFYEKGKSEELIMGILEDFDSYEYINFNAKKSLELYDMKKNTNKFFDVYREIIS